MAIQNVYKQPISAISQMKGKQYKLPANIFSSMQNQI